MTNHNCERIAGLLTEISNHYAMNTNKALHILVPCCGVYFSLSVTCDLLKYAV